MGKIKILIVLILFLALATTPFWVNMGSIGKKDLIPVVEKPKGKQCVEEKMYMRKNHMNLLHRWRDDVVRGEGPVKYKSHLSGKVFEKSLSNTCLEKCHTSFDKFCNRCHQTANVQSYCTDCHLTPKQRQKKEISYGLE